MSASQEAGDGAASPPGALALVHPSEAPSEDADVLFDFETLTPEVGWMLIGVGVLGVILPGLPGAPFFIAGGAVLVPGGKERITKWIGKNPRPMVRRSLAQLGRFMDDLESRYPRRQGAVRAN